MLLNIIRSNILVSESIKEIEQQMCFQEKATFRRSQIGPKEKAQKEAAKKVAAENLTSNPLSLMYFGVVFLLLRYLFSPSVIPSANILKEIRTQQKDVDYLKDALKKQDTEVFKILATYPL